MLPACSTCNLSPAICRPSSTARASCSARRGRPEVGWAPMDTRLITVVVMAISLSRIALGAVAVGLDRNDQGLQNRGAFANHRQVGTLDHVAARVEVDRHHLVAGTNALQVLDSPGNPHRHVNPRGDPGTAGADLA